MPRRLRASFAAFTQAVTVLPLCLSWAMESSGQTPELVCRPGYVPREARAGDHVCVTAATRARTVRENGAAPTRVDPQGAYGANSCLPGFVWREAYPGDVVCVEPEVRALVREDNRLATSRLQPAGAASGLPETAVLCERSYANWSWVYVRSGIYIDNAGSVYRYESRTKPTPAQILATLPWEPPQADSRSLVTELQALELESLRHLIVAAASGHIASLELQGADQGSTTSMCWLALTEEDRVADAALVLLDDASHHNESPEAAQIEAELVRLFESSSAAEGTR